ncbi:CBS domain-containing protein [Candidatus Bathyarchaeota archaeon]|nr:CBS domain-containing protein [Candidatus Bathyarchaeota archaeon]
MDLCVEDIMSRDVVTVEINQTIKNAARSMAKFGVSGLVVLHDGNLVGILTERDILMRVVTSGINPESVRVRDVMSEPVIVVSPAMPLDKAVNIMFHEKIKKLPVVDRNEEHSKLIGILSLTDVARLQPKLLESIKCIAEMNEIALEASADFYIR